eukprot:c37419_g1_i1 orf=43-345(+)
MLSAFYCHAVLADVMNLTCIFGHWVHLSCNVEYSWKLIPVMPNQMPSQEGGSLFMSTAQVFAKFPTCGIRRHHGLLQGLAIDNPGGNATMKLQFLVLMLS